MRELVRTYLQNGISRRGFANRMLKSGFSAAATNAVLAALAPAQAQDEGKLETAAFTRAFRGTGGDLLAE